MDVWPACRDCNLGIDSHITKRTKARMPFSSIQLLGLNHVRGTNVACKSLQKLAGCKLAQARPSGLEPAPARNQPSPPRRTFLCKTGKRTHLLAVIKFLNYVEEEHLKHVISFKVTMRGQLGKGSFYTRSKC